jgi:TorA maturation chaperone TorD
MITYDLHVILSKSYRLLALLLLPPSLSHDKLLEKREMLEELAALEPQALPVHPEVRKLLEKIKDLAARVLVCIEDEKCWREYSAELTSLLISKYKHVPCPPYESIYRVKTKPRMFDVPSIGDSLRRFYSYLGLEADIGGKVPSPDHISVELEYMAALHDIEKILLSENDLEKIELAREVKGLKSEFIQKHLGTWLGGFAECLRRNSRNNIIIKLAELLEELAPAEQYL